MSGNRSRNKWVKPTGTTLRSVPAAYPRRYVFKEVLANGTR